MQEHERDAQLPDALERVLETEARIREVHDWMLADGWLAEGAMSTPRGW